MVEMYCSVVWTGIRDVVRWLRMKSMTSVSARFHKEIKPIQYKNSQCRDKMILGLIRILNGRYLYILSTSLLWYDMQLLW